MKPTFYNIETMGDHLRKIRSDLYPNNRVGIWGCHSNIHDGHRATAYRTREKCDYVVGIYWQNAAEWYRQICGVCHDIDRDFDTNTLNEISKLSDAVLVFKGDYTLFDGRYGYYIQDLWPLMLFQYPDKKLEKYGFDIGPAKETYYTAFRSCQAIKIIMNNCMSIQYGCGCARDGWRWAYKEWQESHFNFEYDLVEPILDKYGNNLSGGKERCPYGKKIEKAILLPYFKNAVEVNEHIKDIEGLSCEYLLRFKGFIYAKFTWGEYWWNEGVRADG